MRYEVRNVPQGLRPGEYATKVLPFEYDSEAMETVIPLEFIGPIGPRDQSFITIKKHRWNDDADQTS